MIYYSFDHYWKEFGKFHNSVIKNDKKLENDLYQMARDIWKDALNTDDKTYDAGYSDGWDAAEEHYKIKEKDKA